MEDVHVEEEEGAGADEGFSPALITDVKVIGAEEAVAARGVVIVVLEAQAEEVEQQREEGVEGKGEEEDMGEDMGEVGTVVGMVEVMVEEAGVTNRNLPNSTRKFIW